MVKYELTVGLLVLWQKEAVFEVSPVKWPFMEWQKVSPNWKRTVPSEKIEERPMSRGRSFPDASYC